MTFGLYREHVIVKIQEAGCRYKKRGKGDYDVWYSPISKQYFQVDDIVSSHFLANMILKNAGLPPEFGRGIKNFQ